MRGVLDSLTTTILIFLPKKMSVLLRLHFEIIYNNSGIVVVVAVLHIHLIYLRKQNEIIYH